MLVQHTPCEKVSRREENDKWAFITLPSPTCEHFRCRGKSDRHAFLKNHNNKSTPVSYISTAICQQVMNVYFNKGLKYKVVFFSFLKIFADALKHICPSWLLSTLSSFVFVVQSDWSESQPRPTLTVCAVLKKKEREKLCVKIDESWQPRIHQYQKFCFFVYK